VHDASARHTRSRPEVDQVIRAADRLLVVLDDDHGVADVAHAQQRVEKPAVVALVQPDRGLVQDVDHAGEGGAHLARQPDALGLAPREGRSRAVEGQVAEAHGAEEVEARPDLLQHLGGDLARGAFERKLREVAPGLVHREGGDLDDGAIAEPHGGALGAKPRSPARRATRIAEKLAVPTLRPVGAGLLEATHEPGQHALPLEIEASLAGLARPGHAEGPLPGPEEQDLALALGQPPEGPVHVDPELGDDLPAEPVRPARLLGDVRPPRLDGTLVDGQRVVGHHEVGIDLDPHPEAVAVRAHPLRAVEREGLGRELGERDAALRAGGALGEDPVGLPLEGRDQGAVAHLEGHLDGLGHPRTRALLERDAIDHRLHGVLAALVERLEILGEHDLAIHAQAQPAGAAGSLEQLPVLALSVHQQRREEHETRARLRLQELARDLLRGLTLDAAAAAMAVLQAHPRVQHSQVVRDLGNRPDGGARVGALGLLLDGDRGREPPDGVVARLLHLAEELPRVGGQRLDVAALPLGVERVEGQRRLPRARDPRQHHQLLLGDLDGDGLEVVLPRTLDEDVIELHGSAEHSRRLSDGGRASQGPVRLLPPSWQECV
jgi:hypothetical protein